MSKWHKLRYSAFGLCVALFAGQPALADDTEIFVGQTLDRDQANVLFIMDTSGSMGATVDWDAPYDPAVSYDGDCDADRVYWTNSGNSAPSDCSTANEDWVFADAFVCQQGWNVMAVDGNFTDRMARYRHRSNVSRREWQQLRSASFAQPVECRSDDGRHGDGTDELRVYAAQYDHAPFHTEPGGPNNIDWNAYPEYTVYTGNYLNYINNPSNFTFTRLDVVKLVARNTLGRVAGLNVGMMRFDSYGNGGMVTRAISDIGGEFTPMTTALDNYRHGGVTPLSETLYEAGQYLAGRNVDYGLNSRGNGGTIEPSVTASRDGDTYVSPITNVCQKNFVVLLTDGEPVRDTGANDRIGNLPGFFEATGQTSCSGNCLDEMAAYLHNHDLSPLDGQQNADVFTIGFHTNQRLLQDTANRGGGLYYTADSAEQLTTAFTEILDNIIEQDVSFTAPAVAVNTFNRLTHRDELYVSMFKPANNPHWEGNVKRYRLGNTGGQKIIYDATNRNAINPDTGTFYEDAKSFWTLGAPDGFDTTMGGFRSRLHADRNVFTSASGATSNVALNTLANRVHESNSNLTAGLLNIDAAERVSLLQWARGVDADGQSLNILGDALHARPIIMSWGGSQADPDLTLFYITNDGYFHAVDPTATATQNMEIFSFIPYELLSRLGQLRANERNNPPKFYGLDGQLSSLIIGDNGNGVVDSGEKAMIYFGMRRGGSNYYAMDVTNRSNPRLEWVIKGGEGDFEELGQTWSEMTPARVKINGAVRNVLVFGGGYDTRQDPAGANEEDGIGRAIYMVDAETGERIWWAANAEDNPSADLPLSQMTNSIPSDLRVIDINGDHIDDRIYVGDMTGQMWRFDIHSDIGPSAGALVTGGVIADIGGTSKHDNRRIFYPPSVSLVADDYLGSFLAISFGTGHRANPLGTAGSTVDDAFYMLRDPYIFRPQEDANGYAAYTSSTDSQFYDVTNDLEPSTEQLNGHMGWKIRLDHEEKVLAKSLVADGRIFFTSYLPDAPGQMSCNPQGALGSARIYSVAIGTGEPRIIDEPLPPTDDPECNGRCVPTQGPIPPEPVLVFTEPNPDPQPDPCDVDDPDCDEPPPPPCSGFADAALVIGTQVRDPSICTAPVRTYWVADGEE